VWDDLNGYQWDLASDDSYTTFTFWKEATLADLTDPITVSFTNAGLSAWINPLYHMGDVTLVEFTQSATDITPTDPIFYWTEDAGAWSPEAGSDDAFYIYSYKVGGTFSRHFPPATGFYLKSPTSLSGVVADQTTGDPAIIAWDAIGTVTDVPPDWEIGWNSTPSEVVSGFILLRACPATTIDFSESWTNDTFTETDTFTEPSADDTSVFVRGGILSDVDVGSIYTAVIAWSDAPSETGVFTSIPTGWTTIASGTEGDVHYRCFYRVVEPGDPGTGPFTFAMSGVLYGSMHFGEAIQNGAVDSWTGLECLVATAGPGSPSVPTFTSDDFVVAPGDKDWLRLYAVTGLHPALGLFFPAESGTGFTGYDPDPDFEAYIFENFDEIDEDSQQIWSRRRENTWGDGWSGDPFGLGFASTTGDVICVAFLLHSECIDLPPAPSTNGWYVGFIPLGAAVDIPG
jgi:hypothetical protein